MVEESPDPQNAPPLAAWLAVLLLATLMLGSMMWQGHRHRAFVRSVFAELQGERFDAFAQRTDQDRSPQVVALGNSLLREATSSADTLPMQAPASWLRVTWHEQDYHTSLWPALRKLAPDVLIIQSDLLLPPPIAEGTTLLPEVKKNLRAWRALQQERPAIPAELRVQQLRRTYQESQSSHNCPPTPWEIVAPEMQNRIQYRYFPDIADERIVAQVREAAGFSGSVLILDIPRSSSLESLTGRDMQRWRTALQQKFRDLPNVHFARLGNAMADACYCDYRHVLAQCRPQTEAALVNLVAQELAPQ
jgi:hypothetical protein